MSAQPLIRILMVEDDPADLRRVSDMLAQAGAHQFSLEQASGINHALECIAQRPNDVLLLDLSLPDGHGLNNITKIQAKAPDLPTANL